MSATISNLKDENGNTIYPQTKTNAVLDGNGNNVDELLAALNLLVNNKVDKITDISRVYTTNSNANKYVKTFYNWGNQRCLHIGTVKFTADDRVLSGKIYTHQFYGSTDNRPAFIDFYVFSRNDQSIAGGSIGNFINPDQNITLYFVSTGNTWEYEVYCKMLSWSCAIFDVNLTNPGDMYFTFDTNEQNVVNEPSSSALTLEPRRLNLTNYQAAIDGATGWNSGYVDIPMADKILRIQYGQENPNDNGNKRINFPQAYDTILFGMGVLTGTVDVQSQRGAVTGLSNTYIEFGQTSNNNQYVRWIAIGIKNY